MTDSIMANKMLLIKVIYLDNGAGVVKTSSLEKLIKTGKIVAFRRSAGWAKVGRDPIRGSGGWYEGMERRLLE
jgi:hypothetical protein